MANNEAIDLIEQVLGESERWQYRLSKLNPDKAITAKYKNKQTVANDLLKAQKAGNIRFKGGIELKDGTKFLPTANYSGKPLEDYHDGKPEVHGLMHPDLQGVYATDNPKSNKAAQKYYLNTLINQNTKEGKLVNKNITDVRRTMKNVKDSDKEMKEILPHKYTQDASEKDIPQKAKHETALILIEALNTLLNE